MAFPYWQRRPRASARRATGQVTPLQAPAKPPAAAQKEITETVNACREVGGKARNSPDLLFIADLTGDGMADYAIDKGCFICKGAASLHAGSGGSQVLTYVGTPTG